MLMRRNSEPQTRPEDEINPKSVLQEKLKSNYAKNSKIERLFYPDYPLKLEDCYLDLALLKPEQNKQEESREKEISRDHVLRAYERIEISKEKLAVDEILSKCEVSTRRRIYIEGAAGAGKSTLCQFMVLNWAKDKAPWNTYQWLFHLRLRDLSNYLNEKKKLDKLLVKVLIEKCLHLGYDASDQKSTKKLFTEVLLNHNNHPVLFILDGLDELKTKGNAKLPSLLQKLVDSNYDLLITSRPGIVTLKRAFNINMDLAVIGFNDDQVKKYVQNFFAYLPVAKKMADDCLSLIEKDNKLWSLAHTPIHLELFCSSWGQELIDLRPLTLTALYELIYEKILKRWIEKQDKSFEDYSLRIIETDSKVYLDYMKHLAFIGMREKAIVLDKDHQNETHDKIKPPSNLYPQLKAMGLLKQSGDKLEFIHLTFQEYLAANYLADCIEAIATVTPTNTSSKSLQMDIKELFQFIANTKFDPFYEVMWWFVAGTLAIKDRAKKTNRLTQLFFDLILQKPKPKTEIEELTLIIRCLNEAYDREIKQKKEIIKHANIWYEFRLKNACKYTLVGNPLVKRFNEAIVHSANILPFIERTILNSLQATNRIARGRVVDAIGRLGAYATPEMKTKLLSLLQDQEKDVRGRVAEAIGQLGMYATPELKAGLRFLAQDKDCEVLGRVAHAIGVLGVYATPELKADLLTLLQNKNIKVWRNAAQAIGALGIYATPELQTGLLLLFENEDVPSLVFAIKTVSAYATPELIAGLLSLLEGENKYLRIIVVWVISELGANATPELKAGLLPLLKDEDRDLRESVANAIGVLGIYATPELQTGLLSLLKDEDIGVRGRVAWTIGMLGAYATPTPQMKVGLLSLLQDKEKDVRAHVAEAIGWQGAHVTTELTAGLLSLLQDKEKDVRAYAAEAIGCLGAHATPELKARWLSLLHDEEKDVRTCLAKAVSRLGAYTTPELKAGLLSLLHDEENEVRAHAAQAIGMLDAHVTTELTAGLLSLLQDKEKDVRTSVGRATGYLGAYATPELQAGFLSLLQDQDSSVRWNVAMLTEKLAEHATPEFKSGLLSLIRDKDSNVRRHAADAIKKFFSTDELLINELLKLAQSQEISTDTLSLLAVLPGTLHYFLHLTFEETLDYAMPERIQPSELLSEIIEKHNTTLHTNAFAISSNYPLFPHVNTVKIKKVIQIRKNVNSNSSNQIQKGNNMQSQSSSSSSNSLTTNNTSNQKEWPFNSITDYLALLHTNKFDLTQAERATLESFQLNLIKLFKKNSNPSELWVAEFICLAIGANKNEYTRLLNAYLKFLQETPIIESYHLEGLGTLINLANIDEAWLTPSHAIQLFAILKGKETLLSDFTNKSNSELYKLLGLWQSLLSALYLSGCEIDQEDKKWIKAVLNEFNKHASKEEKEVVEWLVKLAEQNLLRTSDNRPPLWKRSGAHLLSAGVAACQATAALGTGAATFGVTSLAAIEPGVKMVVELGKAAHEVIRDIKEHHNKKEWFHDLDNLKDLIIEAVVNQNEKEFEAIISQLCAVSDKKLDLIFAHGLLDMWIGLLIGYQEKSHAFLQEGCGKLFTHYLNKLDNRSYEARLFAKTAELLSKYKINPSFPLMWIDFIVKKNQAYVEMPSLPGTLESVRQLYKFIDVLKLDCKAHTKEYIELTNTQKILLAKFANNQNQLAEEMLIDLINDENVKDKSAVESVLKLFLRDQEIKSRVEKAKRSKGNRIETKTTPMIGVIWVRLDKEQRQIILVLCQRQGLIKSAHVEERKKQPLSLLGKVGNMVVTLIVAKGATHVNVETKEQGEGLAALGLSEVIKEKIKGTNKNEPTDDAKQEDDLKLADEVKFVYVGEVVQGGGLLINTSKNITESAERLAREYFSQQSIQISGNKVEQGSQAQSSNPCVSNQGIFGTQNTPSSSSSSSSSTIDSYVSLSHIDNHYVVVMDVGKLKKIKKDKLESLNEKLKGYAEIGSCINDESNPPENITIGGKKIISKLIFDDEEVAKDLIKDMSEIVPNQNNTPTYPSVYLGK